MASLTFHEDKTYLASNIINDKESPTVTENDGVEGLETTTQPVSDTAVSDTAVSDTAVSDNDYDPFDDFDISKIIPLPAEPSGEDLSDYLTQTPNFPDPGDLGEPIDLEPVTQPIAGIAASNNDYDPFDDFDISKIIRLPVELSDEDLSDYLPQNPNVPDPGDLGDPIDIEISISDDVSIFTPFEGDTIDPETDLDPIGGLEVTGGLEVKEAPPTWVYESDEMADFETTPLPEDGVFRTEGGLLEVSGQDSGPIVSDEMADFETTPLPEDGIFRTEGGLLEVYSQSTGSVGSGELEVVGTTPSSPTETGELLI